MTGFYSHYPLSVQLLQKHKFCTLDEFQSFINKYERRYNWYTSIHSGSMHQDFASLRKEAPFSHTIRFPDTFYIQMDCVKIRTVAEQFFKALFLLNLWADTHVRHPSANIMEYIRYLTIFQQPCVGAFTKFADIIKSTDIEHLEENGVIYRESFEKHYGLRWVYRP